LVVTKNSYNILLRLCSGANVLKLFTAVSYDFSL
jgi:hypothetical protein